LPASVEQAVSAETPSSGQAASQQAPSSEQALVAQLSPTAPARRPTSRAPHQAAPLNRAVESTEAMLRLVARRGIAQASLSLRPAQLGAVEVRLRATSEGVMASVAADSAEAAKLLQHAEGDLRRALEDSGVRLLRLDIAWSRDARTGGGERDGSARQPQTPDQGAAAGDADPDAPDTAIQLPNGVLVDVLA
jgi:flagellar hook-length control protein FliK